MCRAPPPPGPGEAGAEVCRPALRAEIQHEPLGRTRAGGVGARRATEPQGTSLPARNPAVPLAKRLQPCPLPTPAALLPDFSEALSLPLPEEAAEDESPGLTLPSPAPAEASPLLSSASESISSRDKRNGAGASEQVQSAGSHITLAPAALAPRSVPNARHKSADAGGTGLPTHCAGAPPGNASQLVPNPARYLFTVKSNADHLHSLVFALLLQWARSEGQVSGFCPHRAKAHKGRPSSKGWHRLAPS